MQPRRVTYRFHPEGESPREFVLHLGGDEGKGPSPPSDVPEWAALEYEQCPHCPLSTDEHPYCPAALSLTDLVEAFDDLVSHHRTRVEVLTEQRTVVVDDVSVQHALGSVMGLALAVSGCPYTGVFRPMARFHLPVASREETVYRACSMYLVAQYLREGEGLEPDWSLEGLRRMYEDVRVVNRHLHQRVVSAARTDSSLNAMASLDAFTIFLPMAVEDSLAELKPLFRTFLTRRRSGDPDRPTGGRGASGHDEPPGLPRE